ncbi:hypothetical protein HHI36_010334 [Cryptolaemus montrouzieri]|uniref:Uncharacterized protein n=1 Tax=Cryptolaemus montrouzieri TaxID=559131 RepID=A0ABD2MIG6_9CUCU
MVDLIPTNVLDFRRINPTLFSPSVEIKAFTLTTCVATFRKNASVIIIDYNAVLLKIQDTICRKQSDDESSEEDDFKLPRNTVKRMWNSEKTLKIETRNQFENLKEEDIDEDHRPMEEEEKQVEETRTTKTTTKSPAKHVDDDQHGED